MSSMVGAGKRKQLNIDAGKARNGDPCEIYDKSLGTVLYRDAYIRAWRGEASPLGAIKAMCLHCMGGARLEVASCTSESCPLWCYRPYRDE